MASRFRTEPRTTYRSVGAASLKPAFGSTTGTSRPDWSLSSRSKSQPAAEPTRSNAIEGVNSPANAAEEKPVKKSPNDSARKRKDRRNLRERRHGTGVVILPGGDKTEEKPGEAKQTLQNTKQNESIGAEEFTPSPSEVTPTKPQRSSRIAHDDVDLDKRDKQDLIDLIEQLEKSLDQKTKEVVTLKGDNQKLRDDNNALLRVVNQVSSLKTK